MSNLFIVNSLKKILPKINRKIDRILIIGDRISLSYNQLLELFPNSQFFIANKSKNILKSFKLNCKEHRNYSIQVIDIFDGLSLFNFALKYGKFDIIIVSGLYTYKINKKKLRYSAKFLYKHLVQFDGIFCIVNLTQDLKINKSPILENEHPIISQTIDTLDSDLLIFFTVYLKKKPKSIFG